jgi:hypothetical protein
MYCIRLVSIASSSLASPASCAAFFQNNFSFSQNNPELNTVITCKSLYIPRSAEYPSSK